MEGTEQIRSNIRYYRKNKNLSQQYVADKLKISDVNYGNIERGKTKITIDRLYKIAQVLDVNIVDLLGIKTVIYEGSKEDILKQRLNQMSLALEVFNTGNKRLLNSITNEKNYKSKSYSFSDIYEFYKHSDNFIMQIDLLLVQTATELGMDISYVYENYGLSWEKGKNQKNK